VLDHIRVRAGQQQTEVGPWRAPDDQTLLPVAPSSCHVVHRTAGESGKVRARARFAEELAGQLIGAQERSKETDPVERRCRNSATAGATSPVVTLMSSVEGGTAYSLSI